MPTALGIVTVVELTAQAANPMLSAATVWSILALAVPIAIVLVNRLQLYRRRQPLAPPTWPEPVLNIRRVAIIGLGPHNRRIYYPQLERRGVSVSLVVDVESARPAVEAFLAGRSLQPERVVYVPSAHRDGAQLHSVALDALQAAIGSFDGRPLAPNPLLISSFR